LYIQGFLFANLVDDRTRRALEEVIPNGPTRERFVFHRAAFLFLMKFTLLYAQDAGALDPNDDLVARHELGKACLMVNDLLFPPDQEAALTKEDGTRQEWERVHDELYSQMLPNAELASHPDVYHALARSDEYLQVFERERAKFGFERGLSLTERMAELRRLDLGRYLRLLLGVRTLYDDLAENPANFIYDPAKFNIDRDGIFSKMTLSEDDVSAFFDFTASVLTDLSASIQPPSKEGDVRFIHDTTAFRKYPLIYTREERDVAGILDYHFLGEKFCQGLLRIPGQTGH
jgi:hypothetical protein